MTYVVGLLNRKNLFSNTLFDSVNFKNRNSESKINYFVDFDNIVINL